MTVSIGKFGIIELVSNRIEYCSNYSIRFEMSNIRTALLNTKTRHNIIHVLYNLSRRLTLTSNHNIKAIKLNASRESNETNMRLCRTGQTPK